MNTIASWNRWCEDKKSLKVISLFSNAVKLNLPWTTTNYEVTCVAVRKKTNHDDFLSFHFHFTGAVCTLNQCLTTINLPPRVMKWPLSSNCNTFSRRVLFFSSLARAQLKALWINESLLLLAALECWCC